MRSYSFYVLPFSNILRLYFYVDVFILMPISHLQILELREKLDDSQKKVEEVRKLERKKDELATRLETVGRTKNQLEKGLQVNYPHPTEKLLQMLSSFERDFQVLFSLSLCSIQFFLPQLCSIPSNFVKTIFILSPNRMFHAIKFDNRN